MGLLAQQRGDVRVSQCEIGFAAGEGQAVDVRRYALGDDLGQREADGDGAVGKGDGIDAPALQGLQPGDRALQNGNVGLSGEQQNAVLLLRLHGECFARLVDDAIKRRFYRLGFFFNSNGVGRGLREAAAGLGLGDVKGRSGV